MPYLTFPHTYEHHVGDLHVFDADVMVSINYTTTDDWAIEAIGVETRTRAKVLPNFRVIPSQRVTAWLPKDDPAAILIRDGLMACEAFRSLVHEAVADHHDAEMEDA